MAAIALLLNEDVRVKLGEILRERGYDVLHVLEADRITKILKRTINVSELKTIASLKPIRTSLIHRRFARPGQSYEPMKLQPAPVRLIGVWRHRL